LSVHGAENLLITVQESETKEEFLAKIKSI
jgi:hypothetical protein